MTELAVATLQVLTGPVGKLQPKGAPVKVQFNPAALRYQLSNTVSVDKASGKMPASQYLGTSAGTLAFDLVFDTTYPADNAAGSDPAATEKYDVRRYLRPIQSMVASGVAAPGGAQAKDSAKKSTVPMVRFSYGTFSMTGLVTGLNIDFELFSEDGVPLRAKAAVTMKEIDPAFLANEYGSGSNTAEAAKDPAKLTAGPAGSGAGGPPDRPTSAGPARSPDDRSAVSKTGESAADLLTRLGRDASAWKELSLPGISPISLPAGVVVELPASLSAEVSLGVGANAATTLGGGPGGPAAAALRPGADPREITAAGGLQGALAAVAVASAGAAAATTKAGFDPPPAARGGRPPSAQGALTQADMRGLTFGAGVPLRDVVAPRQPSISAARPTAARPTAAPGWAALSPALPGGGAGRQPRRAGEPTCGCARGRGGCRSCEGGCSGGRPGNCDGGCG